MAAGCLAAQWFGSRQTHLNLHSCSQCFPHSLSRRLDRFTIHPQSISGVFRSSLDTFLFNFNLINRKTLDYRCKSGKKDTQLRKNHNFLKNFWRTFHSGFIPLGEVGWFYCLLSDINPTLVLAPPVIIKTSQYFLSYPCWFSCNLNPISSWIAEIVFHLRFFLSSCYFSSSELKGCCCKVSYRELLILWLCVNHAPVTNARVELVSGNMRPYSYMMGTVCTSYSFSGGKQLSRTTFLLYLTS